jgi:hypothetical protein
MITRKTLAAAATVLALLPLGTTGVLADAATSLPTQPGQPTSGPGGSDYTHTYRVHQGGLLDGGWYVFEPTSPAPKAAPVTVIMHGYGEFDGYDMMKALIEHTVKHGSIVIYPRWQATPITPCPGPYDINSCVTTSAEAIKQAIAYLRADPTRVQPDLTRASYFGFSFGGIITANMANRWQSLGLPQPRVVMLDDPHDGGLPLSGAGEPALDDTLSGIPPTTYLECHSGARGVMSKPDYQDSSCNAVFAKVGHIPAARKDLVMLFDDAHGTPDLSSKHGVCAGGGPASDGAETRVSLDAYDWNYCWKVWDALRDYALFGKNKSYAVGNTAQHRSIGLWNDGTPVKALKIQDLGPIRP